MTFKSLGWVVLLLLAGLAVLVLASMAWMLGLGWAAGLLGIVWGGFMLAQWRQWLAWRDLAWAAGCGYGIGVIRWLELPLDQSPTVLRWLAMAGYALCLLCFVWLVPALLAWAVQRLRPRAAPGLPVEAPARPEMLSRWDARD